MYIWLYTLIILGLSSFVHRDYHLKKVEPFIGKEIIKVFTGQRRVGKSYMMRQLMSQLESAHLTTNILFIDKEKAQFDFIKDHNDLIRYVDEHRRQGQNALFIDEIQEIEGFERALRSFYTEPGFDIYCTGSNAHMLSGELATYLSGRYVEVEIHTLSYLEFLKFQNMDNTSTSLQYYLRYGGLPYLKHLPLNDEVVFDYLNNIYSTILFKDVIKRHGIRNITFMENLVRYLSDNLGSIVSGKKISDYLKSQQIKISTNVVLDYLNHLSSAYFVYKTSRAQVGGKKLFEIGEKYFFEDIGLRNAIAGFNPADIHKVIENVVFSHLRFHGYKVHVGVLGSKEIDFIAEKNGEKTYLQVCYLLHDQTTIKREFGNLLAIKDQYPKIVVSMDHLFAKNTYLGVKHMHIREFLTKFS